ncbi:alpha/beta fold hydrolase [Cyanobium sp. HWJ4-Hawea]|nr:alpha/beta fold hydrolase [Cyanobium sp. HWJ4-Hawea]
MNRLSAACSAGALLALPGMLAALSVVPLARPGLAVERVDLVAPFSGETYAIPLSELADPKALLAGKSDLADLDRALNGSIGRQLIQVLHNPLPLSEGAFDKDSGSPLLQQVILVLSSLGELEGFKTKDISADVLANVIDKASVGGKITFYSLLQALPGQAIRINLPLVVRAMNRNAQQRELTNKLLTSLPPVAATPGFSKPGPAVVELRELDLVVNHRSVPLSLVVIQPSKSPNGRLVVISHGLWDSPKNFEGWARHLASYGYTVVLPVHPGSDQDQQRAMLAGESPPPTPQELRLRPMDVSAVLDAIEAGKLPRLNGVQVKSTVVVGHSWGAITALQLAGGRSRAEPLQKNCGDLTGSDRNFSWILQCSFVSVADSPSQADPRVTSVIAVSPPIGLLFDPDAAKEIQARVLLVSGSKDWVVPPDPEALAVFSQSPALGHRLVLVQGGDHFNLRAPLAKSTAKLPVLAPLILAWVNGTFAAGSLAAPAPGAPSLLPVSGWGRDGMVLVDVSPQQAGANQPATK